MADQELRVVDGKRATQGDTGDGQTGVPADEQGISNRPGDEDTDDVDDDDDDNDDDVDDVDDAAAEDE